MLSIFRNSGKPKHPIFDVSLSGAAEDITASKSDHPHGVLIRVPTIIVMGSVTRRSSVSHFISKDKLRQMTELVGIPQIEYKEIERVGKVRIERPKYCKNGHRLLSINVIHWPNGNEDCRECYFLREAVEEAKKGKK